MVLTRTLFQETLTTNFPSLSAASAHHYREDRTAEVVLFWDYYLVCKSLFKGLQGLSASSRVNANTKFALQWSAVRVTPSGNPRDLNFSRTVAGITKWFLVTIEGYLSYLLPKFEDLIPTSLGDIAI